MYHLAHSVALVEYLITLWISPSYKTHPYVTPTGTYYISTLNTELSNIQCTGIVMVVLGQILRSGAMIHAAQSFSHTVAFRKLKDHVLVTDGVYACVIAFSQSLFSLTKRLYY